MRGKSTTCAAAFLPDARLHARIAGADDDAAGAVGAATEIDFLDREIDPDAAAGVAAVLTVAVAAWLPAALPSVT